MIEPKVKLKLFEFEEKKRRRTESVYDVYICIIPILSDIPKRHLLHLSSQQRCNPNLQHLNPLEVQFPYVECKHEAKAIGKIMRTTATTGK